MAFKKRRKSSRYRGTHTHGRGFKKKARGSGHRGGFGMAGTGKRGDQKKSMIINLYGNDYFGKDKAIRRPVTIKSSVINLDDIERNINSYVKRGIAKEKSGSYELNLSDTKILGSGDVKSKLIITALSASKSAIDKVKKAGGNIILPVKAEKKKAEKKEVEKEEKKPAVVKKEIPQK